MSNKIQGPYHRLSRIDVQGEEEDVQIYPLGDFSTKRRGLLKAGAGALAATITLGACVAPKRSTTRQRNARRKAYLYSIKAHRRGVYHMILSSDDKYLITSSWDRTVKIWKMNHGELLKTYKIPKDKKATRKRRISSAVRRLALSPDNSKLVGISTNGYIRVWPFLNHPGRAYEKRIKDDKMGFIKFSPQDENQIIVATAKGKFFLFDISDGIEQVKEIQAHKEKIRHISFSNDKSMLASADFMGNIKICSFPELKTLQEIKGHKKPVPMLMFTPDDKLLISAAYDSYSRVWDVQTGKKLAEYEFADKIRDLGRGPQGEKIVIAGHSPNIQLWDRLKNITLRTYKHKDRILDIQPLKDYSEFLSASKDTNVGYWSLEKDTPLAIFKGHKTTVNRILVTKDNHYAISSDLHGAVIIWDLIKREKLTHLFDKKATSTKAKGQTFRIGSKIITLPCNSPLPANATCLCNCVYGTKVYPSSKRRRPRSRPRSGGYIYRPGGRYCSCNKVCTCNTVCTCVPVCHATKLLHPDAVIRGMAIYLLSHMGQSARDYMNFIANRSSGLLKDRIHKKLEIIETETQNFRPNIPANELVSRLYHSDEIVRIMAAQMLRILHTQKLSNYSREIQSQIDQLIFQALEQPWYTRYQ